MMKSNNLRVVLDTNVLIVSLIPHLKFYWVYEKLLKGEYSLYLSNDILMEYQEQISYRYSYKFSNSKLDSLLLLPNVKKVTPFYKWDVITDDPDDNKFVDCTVSSDADYLVTNDKHFQVLKSLEFPKVEAISLSKFQKLLP